MAGEGFPVPGEAADDHKEDVKDDSEESQNSRKKKKASREAGYFNASILFGEDVKSPETEGETESRWQKLLNKIFGRIAPVENIEPDPVLVEATDDAAEQMAWEWEGTEPEAYDLSTFDTAEATDTTVTEQSVETVDEAPEYSPEEAETNMPETQTEGGGDEPPELPPFEMETPSEEPEEPTPSLATETIPESPVEMPAQVTTKRPDGEMVSPAVQYEQATEQTPQVVREETVLDRRAAWGPAAVVAGIDYLRGRKLKREIKREDREIKRQARQLEELKKRTEQVAPIARRAEQVAQTSQVELEQVKARTKRFEQLKRPIEKLEKRLERRTEARKQAEEVRKSIEQAAERSQKPPEMPPPLPEISPEVAPVVVMQEVAEAAEHNAPLEAAYELRSEIKDESQAQQSQGAASVGAVLAGIHKETAAQHAAISQAMQTDARMAASQPVPSLTGGQSLYRKAAMSGFWTGVVIIGILIVIAII